MAEDTRYGVIYLIKNKITGKMYVGQTTESLESRWRKHCLLNSRCRILKRAIAKYGQGAFSIEGIDSGDSPTGLNEKEKIWISRLNTLVPQGYNMLLGGEQHPLMREAKSRGRVRYLNTLASQGLAKGPSTLTTEDVETAFRWFEARVPQKEIASHFGVHASTISHILAGKNWAHLHTDVSHLRIRKLSFDQAVVILESFKAGASSRDLQIQFQLTKGAMNKILRGASYADAFRYVMGKEPGVKP